MQSSTLLLLAANSVIPPFDAAVDTGWETVAVYQHLHRLIRIAEQAGIPLVPVSAGHIRADALDPRHRFASMPLCLPGVQDFWRVSSKISGGLVSRRA